MRLLLSALYITDIFLNRYAAGVQNRFHSGDQKLRILLAGDSFLPKVDGVATFAEHAIKQLVKNGHQVHVLTSRTSVPVLFGADVTRLPGVEPEMCLITPRQSQHYSVSVSLVKFKTSRCARFRPKRV